MTNKIFTLIAATILLSACGPNSNLSSSKPTEAIKKNVFTSIKDAVTKNIALKCIYSDDGQATTTYIKGQLVRFSGSGKEANVEGLMKENKFYLWNSTNKQGMILDISKMDGAKMGETPVKSVDDVITQLEAKKENCTVSTESDSIFELPADVTFSAAPDFSGLTK